MSWVPTAGTPNSSHRRDAHGVPISVTRASSAEGIAVTVNQQWHSREGPTPAVSDADPRAAVATALAGLSPVFSRVT